ncbi:MAG: TauD/TfdA family dioxygenase [Burkholderiaceae bacterium]
MRSGSDFGVEVIGLDLRKDISDATRRELVLLFHKHRVIRVPGQTMELRDYARFGEWFGKPHPHAVEKVRVAGYPGVTLLNNADDETRNTAAYWHTDNTYEAEPATATMLWAETVPAQGGETMVADMVAAYSSLPAATKQQIATLRSLNGWYKRDEGFFKKELPHLSDEQVRALGINTHPLVRQHPVTGRLALYGVTGSSFGIEGMPLDEGLGLLKELTAHALKPENILGVGYQVGDIAAWDTLATLHSATPHADPRTGTGMLRRMYRISVKGGSPYAALQAAAAII